MHLVERESSGPERWHTFAEAHACAIYDGFRQSFNNWTAVYVKHGSDSILTRHFERLLWQAENQAKEVADPAIAEATVALFAQSYESQAVAVNLIGSYIRRDLLSPALGVRYLAELARSIDETTSNTAKQSLQWLAAVPGLEFDDLTRHLLHSTPEVWRQDPTPIWGPEPPAPA